MTTALLITGASKGIGRGIAEKALENENVHVWNISREENWKHERLHFIQQDLSIIEPDALASLCHSCWELIQASKAEKVVLVNNAGVLGEIAPLSKGNAEDLANVIYLNATVPAILMQSFLQAYKDFTGTKIVLNISSGAGKYPVDGWGAYCSSKAALDMFSLVAKAEEQIYQQGFYIFSVAPGVVDTAMQGQIRLAPEADFSNVQKFKDYKTSGALSSPKQVAEKLWQIIHFPQNFQTDVLWDVRKF